jgi:hypothetical protein
MRFDRIILIAHEYFYNFVLTTFPVQFSTFCVMIVTILFSVTQYYTDKCSRFHCVNLC